MIPFLDDLLSYKAAFYHSYGPGKQVTWHCTGEVRFKKPAARPGRREAVLEWVRASFPVRPGCERVEESIHTDTEGELVSFSLQDRSE